MMMIEIRNITIRCIAAVLISAYTTGCSKIHSEFTVKTIRTSSGWGYAIKKDKQSIIYQEYIPSQEGNISFKTKDAALQTGKLVIRKLEKNENPGLTENEIKNILISEPSRK